MNVEEELFDTSKAYEARGIIAKIMPIGWYKESPLVRKRVYQYLTLDCGDGRNSICVKYVGEAPFVEQNGEKFLDASALKEGEIVVSPGFIYKKVAMSGVIMTEHLKALKTYRRKTILDATKEDGPAIDLGEIDFAGVTKQ